MHIDDDPTLAGLLDFGTEKVNEFDVFVFELCQGNISKKTIGALELQDVISICDQLLRFD